jgi:hypothetical protein
MPYNGGIMNLAPIALFAYKRHDHLIKTLGSLKENELASNSDLFIYSDAPKTIKDESSVRAVRSLIKDFQGFRSISIVEQPFNKGLAISITEGVADLVSRFGKVIVLEDDIITSKYFLRFMNDALEEYQNQNSVMHISGYMFPIDTFGLSETFFLRPASSWGWATWQRAWKYFEKDPQTLIKTFDSTMIREFNIDNSFNYFSQVQQNAFGKINTWAIFWYANIYLNKGLCLYPRESLCFNIGHDGSGQNCGISEIFDVPLARSPVKVGGLPLEINSVASEKLKKYFQSVRPYTFKHLLTKVKSFFENEIKT